MRLAPSPTFIEPLSRACSNQLRFRTPLRQSASKAGQMRDNLIPGAGHFHHSKRRNVAFNMASLMETFEQQYAALSADITSKTSRLSDLSGVERKMHISQVERQMEEAHELLEQMDLEVKAMAPPSRQKYQIRLKSYIAELSLLDKELRARIIPRDENFLRDELFEGDYIKDDQKQRLLDNTERLERSSRQLDGGYKLAVEAEQMGAQILTDLSSQRETIKKSKSRVQETNYDIGKSSRIVNGMIRGLKQQKWILYIIAAVIFLTVILAIYFTIRKHS